MLKKIFYFFILLVLLFSTGCQKQLMDKASEDGNYHYRNKNLGFSIVLPEEFIYYQTQRTERRGYYDLEFFVPTNDIDYPQEVSGYAKPIVVRVYHTKEWESIHRQQTEADLFHPLGEQKGRVYMIRFWTEIPDDWTDKWNDEMKEYIINNFEIR